MVVLIVEYDEFAANGFTVVASPSLIQTPCPFAQHVLFS